MAKDGLLTVPENKAAPIDEMDEFFKTEMGRDIDRLFNEFTTGKKTYDQAHDEFNAKWGDKLETGNVPPPVTQVPRAPVTRIK